MNRTRSILGAAFAALLCVALAHGIDQTSQETISYTIGPGDSPSTTITSTVTQTGLSYATTYTNTIANSDGWVKIVLPDTTWGVAKWFVQIDNDSTSDVADVRIYDGSGGSVTWSAEGLVPIYQAADSASTERIVTVFIKNPYATGTMDYSVVALAK